MKYKLKDLGMVSTGNTPSKSNEAFYDSEDIGFVKPEALSDCKVTETIIATEYVSEEARSKARIVGEGAVFVTCIGSIGKIGLADREFAFNQQINSIKPNEKVLSKYLAYCLLYNKKALQAIANAPVVPIINKSQFEDFEIDIEEDIDAQKRIVEILDKLNSVILSREIELQELDNLIKSRFVEMFGNPISNPMNIRTKPMTELCDIIDGDRGKNYPTAEEFLDEGYCLFLNAKNVTSTGFNFENCMFVTQEKDEVLRKGKLQRGDVVLTTRGTIGNMAFFTDDIPYEHVRINSGMVILRMNRDEIDEVYFMEQFKMQLADIKEKIASGSAQPQLPISTMNKIHVMLPNVEKQKQFAHFVEQVDKLKFKVQKSLKETQVLMDSLMQQYFG